MIYEYNRVKNDNVFFSFIDLLIVVIVANVKRMTTVTTKFEKEIELRVIQLNKTQKQGIFLQSRHLCENQKCLNFNHYC